MYTGTMIEDLIATVERAECLHPSAPKAGAPGTPRWATAEPAEILRDKDLDLPVAYLLEQSYGEQLVEVA